jgi:hypothetical protein
MMVVTASATGANLLRQIIAESEKFTGSDDKLLFSADTYRLCGFFMPLPPPSVGA